MTDDERRPDPPDDEISPEEWQAALKRHQAKEEQRAREIFGDRERFAIPDADSDV